MSRPNGRMGQLAVFGASNHLRGLFWMVVTGLLFVAVTALVKSLEGRIPAAEAAFLRYILGLGFLIPMLRPILQTRLTKRHIALFSARGLVHTLGVTLWFYAMSRVPIAEVTAMNYLSPIWVTLGAALFLGERFAFRRLLAIFVAICGVLLILRPGFREVDLAHLGMIGTSIFFAIGYLIAKKLSAEVTPAVIVGMLSITVTIGLAPLAMLDWVTPTLAELGILFVVACFATAGHYTMTLAFAAAPIALTQPITFLQLVWSVLLGVVFFAEPADIWVIIGGSLIVAAISFIAWREAMPARAEVSE